jgi:hypothetical protein
MKVMRTILKVGGNGDCVELNIIKLLGDERRRVEINKRDNAK